MPTIIACFKWVVDEAYIRRGSSGELDFSSVDYKISDYDRNAIEEAVRLKETLGGSAIAVTVGAPAASRGVKDALSRGTDQAWFASDDTFGHLDSSRTAAILAEIIRSRIGQYDLIICGEGSGDLYAQQVGPRLAENLRIPCISFVQKVTISENRLIADRKTEEGIEVIAAPLPALVTVLPDINSPRIPGVKDTLMAGKKPAVTIKNDELQPAGKVLLQTIRFVASRMERDCERFGTDTAEIAKFVGSLRKKGVIG
ncbi:MAG: electron transfer flavoprotein subunit beta/FixA family protein [Deltaproteobacteria bacterium]|nr:electron transfer flavoprotein subunit beta/FixA family protein [Deltaproteobacteria bacterium]